jgi:hypothetical protein
MSRVRLTTALAVAGLLFVVSCGGGDEYFNGGSVDDKSNEQKIEELLARPDIEQVVAKYREMEEQIVDELTDKIAGLSFYRVDSTASFRGCGMEYSGIDRWTAQKQGLGTNKSDGNLPDEQWPQALKIVTDIAAQYGFGKPKFFQDEPGMHHVVLSDPYGAGLRFSTAVNTLVAITTGCHLTPPAHQNDGSLPPSSSR